MGDNIEFESNGGTDGGYLVVPSSGSGPGLVLVQEWWGLDSGTKDAAELLGSADFVVLAPDLYHGALAQHDEMDKAAQLMTDLPPDRAARDMSGAIDYLAGHDAVTSDGVGVVGFCMGGMLAFLLAAGRPDKVKAVAAFYGYPSGDTEPDWSKLQAPVRGHMAENDDFFPPEPARALEAKLQGMGKDVQFTIHPGAGHAFMATHNALGTRDEALAEQVWPEAIAFLHANLG